MIKIIDLYIIRKFIFTFFFIIGLFILIAIVFDFSEKIDDFMKSEPPLKAILFEYYLNFIPYFLNLFSPLFIFISAVYFTSRMAANTEIVALLTGGMSFYRLLVPYFIVSVLLSGLSFYLNGWIIPHGNRNLVEFESKYIQMPYIDDGAYIHRQIKPGVFIYMRNYSSDDSSGYRFSYEVFKGNELVYKLLSRKLMWESRTNQWRVEQYHFRQYKAGKEEIGKGNFMYIKLNVTPADFGRKTTNIQTMTNPQLSRYIEEERLRGEELVNYYLIEKHKRYSMPGATFILVLIAFALSSRKIRGGTGLHLGLGILIAFAYILFLQFSSVFATKGGIHPAIACWIPNMIFMVIGLFLLRFAPK